MSDMLERAAIALNCRLHDAMQENNHMSYHMARGICVDLARAVLLAVRDEWLEIYHSTEGKTLPTYEQAEGFPDMIDAILTTDATTVYSEPPQ